MAFKTRLLVFIIIVQVYEEDRAMLAESYLGSGLWICSSMFSSPCCFLDFRTGFSSSSEMLEGVHLEYLSSVKSG